MERQAYLRETSKDGPSFEDMAVCWFLFSNRAATRRSSLTELQSLTMHRVVDEVRRALGGTYPAAGTMARGTVALCWHTAAGSFFFQISKIGLVEWEMNNERLFLSRFVQGDGLDDRFRSSLDRFAKMHRQSVS